MDESPILFHTHNINYHFNNISVLTEWLNNVIEEEGNKAESISIILCNDQYLHELNTTFLNHDTLTDVITFPYSKPGEALEGDIFISMDQISENAVAFNIEPENELHRVMVHGILHLLGYKDDTPQNKKQIKEKENHYLSKIS